MQTEGKLNPAKRLTNHSARKHLVQKLRDSDVAPTDIMQISGHKNIESVMTYSKMSDKQHTLCSDILSSSTTLKIHKSQTVSSCIMMTRKMYSLNPVPPRLKVLVMLRLDLPCLINLLCLIASPIDLSLALPMTMRRLNTPPT